ncbi:MAG: hypothetical protein ACI9DH_000573 [Halioglobus sp.]|jgi:hypothetical protein
MTDTKGSALTALTGANSAAVDQLLIIDKSDTTQGAGGTLKNITRRELAVGLSTAVIVADAVGTAAEDLAAINAAIVAAGTGGLVEFPPNQTYVVKNSPGSSTIIPRIINGNGSTIKVRAEVTTTITTTVNASSTEATLTDSSAIAVGEEIFLSQGTAFTYGIVVQTNNTGTGVITFSNPNFGSGTQITTGGNAVVDDKCLDFLWPAASADAVAADAPMEIKNITFDGNVTNRATGNRWNRDTGLTLTGDGAGDSTGWAWVHHCIFQNMSTNGVTVDDVGFFRIVDNHFENIKGSGIHMGGSGFCGNCIVSNNTFSNVYQLTAATTPTATEFGHVTGTGAIATSNGPKQMTVSDNIVDGCKAYGFDGLNNAFIEDLTLSGNVFIDCEWGAFQTSPNGEKLAVTGNIFTRCGHDDQVVASQFEITQINSPSGKVTVSGNVFTDTVLWVVSESTDVSISGNLFSFLNKSVGTRETGALILNSPAGGVIENISVMGNTFIGPSNSTESAAAPVAESILDALIVGVCKGLTISGNQIKGGRQGLLINSASLINASIFGNTFTNQYNNDAGLNCHGISISSLTVGTNFSIIGNTIYRSSSNSAGAWIALQIPSSSTAKNVLIAGNNITSEVAPAGGEFGIHTSSNSGDGITIRDNMVRMNSTASRAMLAGSLTSACVVTGNDWHLTNTDKITIGGATTHLTGFLQEISEATAIGLNAEYVSLSVAAGTYAVTLAAPSSLQQGQIKVIEMISASGTSVTLALTNVIGGSAGTTATFNAVNETLTLVAAAGKWMVTGEGGVTLS